MGLEGCGCYLHPNGMRRIERNLPVDTFHEHFCQQLLHVQQEIRKVQQPPLFFSSQFVDFFTAKCEKLVDKREDFKKDTGQLKLCCPIRTPLRYTTD